MGCIAQYEGTPDLVSKLKKGQMLTIQAVNLNQQIVSFPLSLAEFAKANEGPATDPKKFEEDQKKMQQELQQKADELRKKLEEQKGAAAPKQ
jgi:predicted RNA-binding protein with RPS1 domain